MLLGRGLWGPTTVVQGLQAIFSAEWSACCSDELSRERMDAGQGEGWRQEVLCVLLEEQIHLPFQSQDVIASSLLLRLEICVTRDVERICGSGGGGEVGFSRHLLWLWAPYWVGPGRLDVQGSAGVVSLVLRMEMCEQESEQVNLAAGQDQNGSQQQGWKWSWAGAHVVTTNLGSPDLSCFPSAEI